MYGEQERNDENYGFCGNWKQANNKCHMACVQINKLHLGKICKHQNTIRSNFIKSLTC